MAETTAWIVRERGQAPHLEACEISPGPGEAIIRIAATGLNFADLLMIEGSYQETPPPPFTPGLEFAGIVEELGSPATDIEVGQRVMTAPIHGGLATHAVVPVAALRPIPDTMDDATAAGFQIAYGTSHLALTRRAALNEGETLVVLGAAGGVGLTAVEIGHQLGARVIAVARGPDKLEIARRAGANVLIDSETTDLRAELTKTGPVNVVYDAVGGAAGEAALRSLAPEGRFLVIGFACGSVPAVKANHLLVKNQTVIGLYWGGYMKFAPEALNQSLADLADWHAQGRIRPHISDILPLDRALDGLELLKDRKATGKIVVTP